MPITVSPVRRDKFSDMDRVVRVGAAWIRANKSVTPDLGSTFTLGELIDYVRYNKSVETSLTSIININMLSSVIWVLCGGLNMCKYVCDCESCTKI